MEREEYHPWMYRLTICSACTCFTLAILTSTVPAVAIPALFLCGLSVLVLVKTRGYHVWMQASPVVRVSGYISSVLGSPLFGLAYVLTFGSIVRGRDTA